MDLKKHEKKHLELLYPFLGECTLFLKRNDAFPLEKPCPIAVYGNGVRYTVKGGTGSGEVNSSFFVNVEEGLKSLGYEILTADWLDKYDENYQKARKTWIKDVKKEARIAHALPPVYCMGMIMPAPEYDFSIIDLDKDIPAIYVVSRISGEGNDRRVRKGDVLLNDSEIRDILELNKRHSKFMLVINAGGVVDLSQVLEVNNILVLSELGSNTGKVLGDILLGKLNPTGKLTVSWAKLEDYPYSMSFDKDETYYVDGQYVGYRYFDSFNIKPLFPFGYGLSYSSFKLDNYVIRNNRSNIEVKVDVTNESNYEGKEVVQVYISKVNGDIYQELIDFKKTHIIAPHKVDTVTISFNLVDLAKYNQKKQIYELEQGEYLVRVGNSSDNTVVVGVISLKEDVVIKKTKNIFDEVVDVDEIKTHIITNESYKDVPLIELTSKDFDIKEEPVKEIEINKSLLNLKDEDLASMNVGYFSPGLASVIGSAADMVPGAAGQTPNIYKRLFNYNLVMSDGPAGLRLTPKYFLNKKGRPQSIEKNKIIEEVAMFFPSLITKFMNKFFVNGKTPKHGEEIYYQSCTALPIGTAIAQSWNKDFAYMCGDIVGTEMELYNIDLWLAPALNIQKSILCGRNFEYYSEDPLLSGIFASELTKGVQSHKGKGVTIKHFACNNQETNRYSSNSIVKEKTLRDIYIKGFSYCISHSSPKAIMSSYNLINGIHTSENRNLINGYLYTENNYQGIVMTDWVISMMASKKDKYPFPKASRVALSGHSLMMPGSGKDVNDILKALKDNDELRKQIQINVSRLLKIKGE